MAKATGIELGARFVRIVELEKSGETTRLTSAITVPSRAFDPELSEATARAKAIDELSQRLGKLAQAGWATTPGVIGVSGRDLMMRYTRIPPGPEHRMKMLIDFEIQEMMAQGGGDLVYGSHVLNVESSGGEQTMLVALAKNGPLEELATRAGQVGLAPRSLVPASLGLYNAFLLSGASLEPGEVALVASVGYESTEICIVRDFDLLFARNVNLGGQLLAEPLIEQGKATTKTAYRALLAKGDVTPSPSGGTPLQRALWSAAEQLTRALESSINFCRMQLRLPALDVSRLFLTGDVARLTGFQEFCEDRFANPVLRFDPCASLDLGGLPAGAAVAEGNPKSFPHQYAVAVGLARIGLEKHPFTIALEPEAITRRRQFAHRRLAQYAGALLALLAIAVAPLLAFEHESKAEALRRQAQREARQFSAAQRSFNAAKQEVDALTPIAESLRAIVLPSADFVGLMRALREVAPDELIVEHVGFEKPQDVSDYRSPRTVRLVVYFEKLGDTTADTHLARLERALRKAIPAIVGWDGTELPIPEGNALAGQGQKYEIRLSLTTSPSTKPASAAKGTPPPARRPRGR